MRPNAITLAPADELIGKRCVLAEQAPQRAGIATLDCFLHSYVNRHANLSRTSGNSTASAPALSAPAHPPRETPATNTPSQCKETVPTGSTAETTRSSAAAPDRPDPAPQSVRGSQSPAVQPRPTRSSPPSPAIPA